MIAILAYIALIFLGIRFLIVISNTLFHYINQKSLHIDTPLISVLVPARNEEPNIGHLLECLTKQEYKNIEIIICDDNSTDRTVEILKDYCKTNKNISFFRGKALPQGWTGKNYACHQLSEKANGELFLFLDADVEISGDILARSIGYIRRRKLTLLSIFPKQLTLTPGEKLTVPLMNWIFLSLLPLPLVVFCKWASFSAANGQFMFFRADHYKRLKCHEMVKSSAVEDIQIMKMLKKRKYRVSTLLGDKRVICRMYTNYSEAAAGFTKNVLYFFCNNLLWVFFFTIFTSLGLVFVALWSAGIALIYLAVALFTRILISVISYQHVVSNLVFIPVQHFAFLHIVFRAIRNRRKGTLEWKERKIPV